MPFKHSRQRLKQIRRKYLSLYRSCFILVPIILFNKLHHNSFLSIGIAGILHTYYKRRIKRRPKNEELSSVQHNTIWSAPRSGNHWVRFIIEYLSSCPTSGCINNKRDVPIHLNTFPTKDHPLAHVDAKSPFIFYKSHWVYTVNKRSTILLIIRDYHEHLTRFSITRIDVGVFDYLDLIAAYHRFNGTKMIMYYEDLLTQPAREIYRIKCFLGASEVRYKSFMKRYNYYVQLSKQGKNRDWRGYNSAGDFRFYQKKLSEKALLRRKNFFNAVVATKKYQCVKPYIVRYG